MLFSAKLVKLKVAVSASSLINVVVNRSEYEIGTSMETTPWLLLSCFFCQRADGNTSWTVRRALGLLIMFNVFFFLGPCSFSDCQDYYGTCTVAPDGSGTAKCKCPAADQCPSIVRAICGVDGKTYPNKCLLEAKSCQLKKRIEVKRKGACSKYRYVFLMDIIELSTRNWTLSKTPCRLILKREINNIYSIRLQIFQFLTNQVSLCSSVFQAHLS